MSSTIVDLTKVTRELITLRNQATTDADQDAIMFAVGLLTLQATKASRPASHDLAGSRLIHHLDLVEAEIRRVRDNTAESDYAEALGYMVAWISFHYTAGEDYRVVFEDQDHTRYEVVVRATGPDEAAVFAQDRGSRNVLSAPLSAPGAVSVASVTPIAARP